MDNDDYPFAELLLMRGADPNIADKLGLTPLHVAQNYQMSELLVNYDANPNSKDIYGYTPL